MLLYCSNINLYRPALNLYCFTLNLYGSALIPYCGKAFTNLDKHGIGIKYFRGDSASYQKDVFEFLGLHVENLYIRMLDFEDIRQQCGMITNWKLIEINYETKEVASIYWNDLKLLLGKGAC